MSSDDSHCRPPPFIATIGPDGEVNGYVRADLIEQIGLDFKDAPRPDGTRTRREGTRITLPCGAYFSHETIDDVFAKMADALHMPREDEP